MIDQMALASAEAPGQADPHPAGTVTPPDADEYRDDRPLRSGSTPVYHGPDTGDTGYTMLGRLPQLFALCEDEDEDHLGAVRAWGLSLPDGTAVTVTPGSFGRWSSARRAARIHDADLVWIGTPSP